MESSPALIAELNAIFNPESIAIVGLPQGMKAGKLFLIALQDMGFPGPIYAVNPKVDEIDGIKSYASVTDIPDRVDLAIVLVPTRSALGVVDECAAKGVKGLVLFTAGGKELGTEEGRALEDRLTETARKTGMRILGPNCMGLYAPRSGLSFFPGLSKDPGHVSLISHSGSLTNILGRMAPERGLTFNKVVSLGNECDLNSQHFLTYFGHDPDTRVIGAYLENIKHGPGFLEALKHAAALKPVILWKVGLTPEGGKAAGSHTGAIAGSKDIWQGVMHQTGAIPVEGWESWVDTLMGFSLLNKNLGGRMAILAGPGGLCVSAAEACGNSGLKLAGLSDDSRSALAEFVPPTGTSLANPIDVGLTSSLQIDIYLRAARIALNDPGVDALVVAGCGMDLETNEQFTAGMIRLHQESDKPLLVVRIPGFPTDFAQTFCQAGVPFFESSERAMKTYALVRQYRTWRELRAA